MVSAAVSSCTTMMGARNYPGDPFSNSIGRHYITPWVVSECRAVSLTMTHIIDLTDGQCVTGVAPSGSYESYFLLRDIPN